MMTATTTYCVRVINRVIFCLMVVRIELFSLGMNESRMPTNKFRWARVALGGKWYLHIYIVVHLWYLFTLSLSFGKVENKIVEKLPNAETLKSYIDSRNELE